MVVADGFSGNIALKAAEGTANSMPFSARGVFQFVAGPTGLSSGASGVEQGQDAHRSPPL